jgi:hypothetical protein
MALVCVFSATAAAQLGSYLGPGILTRGAGQVGTRSGQEVDLRLYADISGVYDNGIQPVSIDSKGNLVQVNALWGTELSFGAYGVHQWRRAQLGLDYRGNFRHYASNSFFDGSDHQLVLGYTIQKSKRLYFDVAGIGGTFSRSIGSVPGYTLPLPSYVDQPTSLLFDNRTYFAQSTASVTYLLSARTSFTAGGDGFILRRQSSQLTGMNGYTLRGSVQHRLSRETSIGANYEHTHFDYPRSFGESNINMGQGFVATQLGRRWTFSLQAGVYQAEVEGLQQVALDPVIAAFLGVSESLQRFYVKRTFPAGSARLTRQFKSSFLSMEYNRSVTPGNGVYLTSRQEAGGLVYSYTGIRKFNFGISGGGSSFSSVGQSLKPYRQVNGGVGLTYALTGAVHLTARYDARQQEIDLAGYRRTSYRATVGVAFSPGNLPLALW